MRKCKRYGGSGHFGNKCNNAVDPAFGEFSDENLGPDDAAENEGLDAAAENEGSDAAAPNDAEPESVGDDEPEDDADAEAEDDAYVNVVHLSLYVLLQFVLKIISLFVQITRRREEES